MDLNTIRKFVEDSEINQEQKETLLLAIDTAYKIGYLDGQKVVAEISRKVNEVYGH